MGEKIQNCIRNVISHESTCNIPPSWRSWLLECCQTFTRLLVVCMLLL